MSIDPNRIPRHVAVIMDGNGRWAKSKGQPRINGHRKGTEATRGIVRYCDDVGVKYLTLYVFSTENWKRPPIEVEFLMTLISEMIDSEIPSMMENNVRLRVLGQLETLPDYARKKLEMGMERTRENTGLNLQLALNYGGRCEIATAVKKLAHKVQDGLLKAEEITEEMVGEHLFLPDVPDPELMIRTGGEFRVSNYLLWQIAYSEIYVSQKLWPDFKREDFLDAIYFYQSRERRFGGVIESDE